MENLPAITNFVKPYYIEELGCEGLTNYDIAKALNRPVKHINQKIERPEFQECCKINQYDLVTDAHQIEEIQQKLTKFVYQLEQMNLLSEREDAETIKQMKLN